MLRGQTVSEREIEAGRDRRAHTLQQLGEVVRGARAAVAPLRGALHVVAQQPGLVVVIEDHACGCAQ